MGDILVMDINRLRELAGMPVKEATDLYLTVDWDSGGMAWLTPAPNEVVALIALDDPDIYDVGSPFSIEEGPFAEFVSKADDAGRFETDTTGSNLGPVVGILKLTPKEAQFFQSNGVTVTSEEELIAGGDAIMGGGDDDLE